MNENVEIFRFDEQQLPDADTSKKIAALFAREYPVFDENDIADRDDHCALRSAEHLPIWIRDEHKVFFVAADTRGNLLGILEYNERPKEAAVLAHISWIMVDTQARGKRVSSLLHKFL